MCPGGEKQPEAGLEQEAEAPALPQASCGSLSTGKRAWNYPHATQSERKFPRRETEENPNDFWTGGQGKIGLSIATLLLIFQATPPPQ